MKKTAFILFLSLMILTNQAQELESMVTDRPDQTESAHTVPKYYLQWEFGSVLLKDRPSSNTELTDILWGSSLFRFGVFTRTEIRIGINLNQIEIDNETDNTSETNTGFLPLQIGIKQNLMKGDGWKPEIALLGGFQLEKVASKNFEGESWAPRLILLMSHEITDRLGLGYNVGVFKIAANDQASYLYTMSLGYALSDKLGVFVEQFSFFNPEKNPDLLADAGFTYGIGNNFQLDLSVGAGLTPDASDYFISAGFSWRIPR